MGSFIDHDMEGDMGGDAFDPGSVVKKRKGLGSRALYASAGARPQPPIQPGATLTGKHIQLEGAEALHGISSMHVHQPEKCRLCSISSGKV